MIFHLQSSIRLIKECKIPATYMQFLSQYLLGLPPYFNLVAVFFNLTIFCKSLILWCTRQESNLRPTESESVTLSNWATGAYGGTGQSCFHQFSVSFTCFQHSNFYHLFHLVFCFHSLAIIFGSLPDWLALILRTSTEFIRKTEKTTILSNRFIGLQFLLCKAEGFEKNYVMIC